MFDRQRQKRAGCRAFRPVSDPVIIRTGTCIKFRASKLYDLLYMTRWTTSQSNITATAPTTTILISISCPLPLAPPLQLTVAPPFPGVSAAVPAVADEIPPGPRTVFEGVEFSARCVQAVPRTTVLDTDDVLGVYVRVPAPPPPPLAVTIVPPPPLPFVTVLVSVPVIVVSELPPVTVCEYEVNVSVNRNVLSYTLLISTGVGEYSMIVTVPACVTVEVTVSVE